MFETFITRCILFFIIAAFLIVAITGKAMILEVKKKLSSLKNFKPNYEPELLLGAISLLLGLFSALACILVGFPMFSLSFIVNGMLISPVIRAIADKEQEKYSLIDVYFEPINFFHSLNYYLFLIYFTLTCLN